MFRIVTLKYKFLCAFFVLGINACIKEENKVDYQDSSLNIGTLREMSVVSVSTIDNDYCVPEYVVARKISSLYTYFRIPSAIITNKGTVLVSYENRELLWDQGNIDIFVSRSESNLLEWTIKRITNNYDSNKRSMNPVFLIDRTGVQGRKGRIYLFYCYLDLDNYATQNAFNTSNFMYKYSDDDGNSWSPESSIKKYWNNNLYTLVIPSAANGIVDKEGTFFIPTMVVVDGKWRSGLVYKRCNGDWFFSSPTPLESSESTVYVDNNGKVVLDCRVDDTNIRRRYVYDINGDTFYKLSEEPVVPLPLKAEISLTTINNNNIYLLSYVDTNRNLRENITLFASTDAVSWKKIARLQQGDLQVSAYSNVCSFDNKTIFAYENNYEIRVQDISVLNSAIVNSVK